MLHKSQDVARELFNTNTATPFRKSSLKLLQHKEPSLRRTKWDTKERRKQLKQSTCNRLKMLLIHVEYSKITALKYNNQKQLNTTNLNTQLCT